MIQMVKQPMFAKTLEGEHIKNNQSVVNTRWNIEKTATVCQLKHGEKHSQNSQGVRKQRKKSIVKTAKVCWNMGLKPHNVCCKVEKHIQKNSQSVLKHGEKHNKTTKVFWNWGRKKYKNSQGVMKHGETHSKRRDEKNGNKNYNIIRIIIMTAHWTHWLKCKSTYSSYMTILDWDVRDRHF